MLSSPFGTDLDSAFGLLSVVEQPKNTVQQPMAANTTNLQRQPAVQQKTSPTIDTVQQKVSALLPPRRNNENSNGQGAVYDANLFNQQFAAEQQQAAAVAAMAQRVQQSRIAAQQQQYQGQGYAVSSPSYVDRMMNKKRDMLKIVLFSMMILLAISMHTFIEYWLKDFVSAKELTYKQELGVRLLYPVVVLFAVWNMKTMRG